MIDFSVLICTYNRPAMLKLALSALIEKADVRPDEIVVVNGGGPDADDVVSRFRQSAVSHGVEITLVQTKNINLATSRNIGLGRCRGDIVALTDDDAEVFPDWVLRMKAAHKGHPEAGAVGGPVLGAGSATDLISRLSDLVTFPDAQQPGYVRTVPGVNVSYKRVVLEKIGGQDESLFRGEDVDFNWRVRKAGYKVYFDPTVKVIHHHRPDLMQFLRQHYMYGRAYYLVRHKWPDMYCVYPRQLRSLRDVLKGIHFFLAAVYEPALYASRLKSVRDKITAWPILFINQCVWRGGMIVQRLLRENR